jgi:alkyldihydroxyacetonephosphate synthase
LTPAHAGTTEKDRIMALSKTAIVQGLQMIVGGANVITDEKELKQSSIDRLRLYEDVHGVFPRPILAAVRAARSTWPTC